MFVKLSIAPAILLVCLIAARQASIAQGNKPVGPVDAKSEVDKYVRTLDYRDLKASIAHWAVGLPASDRKLIVVELSSRLTNAHEVGLKNYADLTIFSRVTAAKMDYPGHGPFIYQDIFLENGRCAWAIETLLNCKLPWISIEVNQKPEELSQIVRNSLLKIIAAMAMPDHVKAGDRP